MTPRVIVMDAPHEGRPCYRALVEVEPHYFYRVDMGQCVPAIKGLNPLSRHDLGTKDGPQVDTLCEVVSHAILVAEDQMEMDRIEHATLEV